ncbi:uncharacterized protein LOC100907425 [Galendromus occidentalis]|uniref:Uncharacterized protein LOC100907425 n=1 Tax=Galendromus occidentalis TaxID=34638 RepID=A0AAJ6QU48_9ACAR|nr:uncharacterized protein LOC100907425 [Galendromus occidentalis]
MDSHPGYKKETILKRFPQVRHRRYLSRFREYRRNCGTHLEKYIQVAQFCKEQFDAARAHGIIVHDRTIRMWALAKAREVSLPLFKASHSWIARFKNAHRISSRRIVKFVSFRQQRNREEIETEAKQVLLDFVRNVRDRYDPREVLNTDQSGFSYLVHTNRTLSHRNEQTTVGVVKSLNSLTHSYTIQPVVNMNGELVGRLYVNLQERTDGFGPRVSQDLPNFPNLYVTCSKSGKLTKNLVRGWASSVFRQMLSDSGIKKCILYVDSWGGHRDQELYELPVTEVNVKIFPKGSTSIIQPLDLYCFRQWKDFAKRLTEHAMLLNIRLDDRKSVLQMQSLIYNQCQHTTFRPLWLCGWRLGGFEVPDIPFPSLAEILFQVQGPCHVENCRFMPFIRCVYCEKILCAQCFYCLFHYHSGVDE